MKNGLWAVTFMIAVAASPFNRAAASVDDACRAGAKEAPLVWYSAQDPSRNAAAIEAFAKAQPAIPVQGFRLASGALATRYASERQGGVIGASIVTIGDPNFIDAGFNKGWFRKFSKTELPALSGLADKWFDHGSALTNINVLGISYNADLAGPNPPRSWQDLVRPELKGKLALGDPRNVPTYMAMYRILMDTYGAGYLQALAKQQPVIFESIVPGTQKLAAGEYVVAAPNVASVLEPVKAQGASIELAWPALTTGVEFFTIISEGAPSPNAAMCFYNFLFTEKGQAAFAGTTSVPAIAGIPGEPVLPADYHDPRIREVPTHAAEILRLLNVQ